MWVGGWAELMSKKELLKLDRSVPPLTHFDFLF